MLPWDTTKPVNSVMLSSDTAVYRVYTGNIDDLAGEWVFTPETYNQALGLVASGKYPNEYVALQDMLSLPSTPKSVGVATLPAGTVTYQGTAAGAPKWGTSGGGHQIFLPEYERDWFTPIN